jgi:hypothetical protein
MGLTIGVVFALVALSGTVLAFQRELLLVAHPQLARASLPIMAEQGAAFSRIVAEWGPRGLSSADLPSAKLPVWQGYFPEGERRYFDAASGELLLTRNPGNDWVLWLRDLHTHLLAGETGEEVLGVVGLIALLMLLSGLYLWWPRWRALVQSLRWHAGPPTRRWFSWHRSSGALLLPLALLVTTTGVAMIYNDAVRSALRWTFGDGPEVVPPPALPVRGQTIDWPKVLEAADGRLPGSELRRIAVPKPGNALISIRAREWGMASQRAQCDLAGSISSASGAGPRCHRTRPGRARQRDDVSPARRFRRRAVLAMGRSPGRRGSGFLADNWLFVLERTPAALVQSRAKFHGDI